MTHSDDEAGAAQGREWIDECWAHYAAQWLPAPRSAEQAAEARAAFDAGARALYELLRRMERLAVAHGHAPLDLARLGAVLGLARASDDH